MAAMLYATVEEAKDAGNKAFASDDAAGAIAAYSAGLNMISTAAAKPDAALQAALYTNRAMAHWKAGDMQVPLLQFVISLNETHKLNTLHWL
jgi:hypothetical protein